MQSLSLDEAQSRLRQIVTDLQPGEQIVLIEAGRPMATLVRAQRTTWPCKAGTAKDQILWIAPDFDAPLDDFEEYMD